MADIINAIGILGGTFDPVHSGHIKLAQYVLKQLAFNEIRFIPCYQPVHRKPPIATPQQRLAMLQLALDAEKQLSIDDREIKRKGPSYMIDTLITLRNDFPETALCLILGFDAFTQLASWKKWQDLLKYAHLIVLNRPESNELSDTLIEQLLAKHETKNPAALRKNLAGKIYQLNMPPIPISATQIRNSLKQQQPIQTELPFKVLQYIKQHNLYQK